MSARWSTLQTTAAGFEKTRVPLVAWDGSRLVPSQYNDDSGLDYYVPRLATLLHINLAMAADLFIGGIVIFSSALGLAGLMQVLKGKWLKAWAVCEIVLLAVLSVRIGDVYVVQSAIVIAAVPWILYLSRNWKGALHYPFLLAVGILVGIANFVRAQAGMPVLLFSLILLAFYGDASGKRRILLVTCLMAGLAGSTLYFRHAFVVRDVYIQNHESINMQRAPHQHPLWHSVYIGLGFVSNPYVPGGYCDQAGLNAVQRVSPTTSFFSPEYDRILGQQVVQLAMTHPYVVLVNVAAKLGILQLIALVAGNIGLLAAIFYRKPLSLEAAFWIATAIGIFQGLLVLPSIRYILGGIAMLVLYSLVSIDHALTQTKEPRLSTVPRLEHDA